MPLIILSLVLGVVISGYLLAGIRNPTIRRTIGWLLLGGTTTAAHVVMLEATPLARMVGLCCVLLGGMKALVYAEWARPHVLTIPRYLVFAFFWFGMDPGNFTKRRRKLSWHHDIAVGIALMLVGTLGAWIVWKMEWRQILLMFIPMSLGFHFGALRVLKGAQRSAGFPVRTLFPNPLVTHGIGDFWSKRWNVGYSQMLQRLIGRPAESVIGRPAALMAIFMVSGMLHEIAITLPCRAGYGLPTVYFTFHGLLTLMERKWKRPLGRIATCLAVILPLPWLFPADFQHDVIARCLEWFFEDLLAI